MTAFAVDAEDPVVREMLALVDALAGGEAGEVPPGPLDAPAWTGWYALAETHGLAPGLSRLLATPRWSRLPDELKDRCRRQHLAQTARSLAARRQFAEIRALYGEADIPVLPLKGLAFAPRLYTDPAARQFGDLDLLVPLSDGERAVALLKERGYRSTAAFTSAEEELLQERQAHFCPLARPGALPVEVHTQVLKDRGDAHRARAEAWSSAVADRDGLLQLDPDHALILAAAHYATHLRLGAGHLKWMVDLLLLLRRRSSSKSPSALWETVRRWNLEGEVAPLLAAAAALAGEPDLAPPGAAALAPGFLVYSPRQAGTQLLASARGRLGSLKDLPGPAARARYLYGLLFPSSAHLRYRYGLPAGRPVLAHRVTHPLRLVSRLVSGSLETRRNARGGSPRRVFRRKLTDDVA